MFSLVVKFVITSGLIVLVSEIAKRNGKIGALIASLPLAAILIMIWMHVDRQDNRKIGDYACYTFWYVLPTLPMFLILPWLLGKGLNFWLALGLCIVVVCACLAVAAVLAKRFGIDLFP